MNNEAIDWQKTAIFWSVHAVQCILIKISNFRQTELGVAGHTLMILIIKFKFLDVIIQFKFYFLD